MPTILPPDGGVVKMLTMEGILGLSWGGGTWFANQAARDMLARGGSGGFVSGPIPKVRSKRGIRSQEKGTIYAQGPQKWVWPDVVVVNGTEYKGGGGGLLYESEGKMLNLTSYVVEQDG